MNIRAARTVGPCDDQNPRNGHDDEVAGWYDWEPNEGRQSKEQELEA